MKLNTFRSQQGVVLIVSLVFLVALTAVAVALMQNSTTDMKMAGATEQRVIAIQEAVSAVDEVIYRQLAGGTGTNGFAQNLVNFPLNGVNGVTGDLTQTNKKTDTVADVDIINNDFRLEADCPASRSASSSQVFSCNSLRIRVIKNYGRNNTSNVEVNSGISQQLLR
ncbi:pilus assembly PilX N-terminal domain-containing protein [Thalassotalea sp. G2M2-11]|uniref:pilus assembly PilX family protein n=1 Tax=Thalassotalea sp. G2M2-11 TaxID=2787627 RepID=UPI001F49A717|nr:pilus assembly PilX N-terminal domain-containing protein [Thalassotalea sp. G2M2-11]